jgi:hypothetical protein
VPIKLWLSWRASSWARTRTRLDRSVKRSNIDRHHPRPNGGRPRGDKHLDLGRGRLAAIQIDQPGCRHVMSTGIGG